MLILIYITRHISQWCAYNKYINKLIQSLVINSNVHLNIIWLFWYSYIGKDIYLTTCWSWSWGHLVLCTFVCIWWYVPKWVWIISDGLFLSLWTLYIIVQVWLSSNVSLIQWGFQWIHNRTSQLEISFGEYKNYVTTYFSEYLKTIQMWRSCVKMTNISIVFTFTSRNLQDGRKCVFFWTRVSCYSVQYIMNQ